MSFQAGEMPVFDRAGVRLGTLTKWSVIRSRTYRINEVEDFGFMVPQRDEAGAEVLTTAVAALLARDNLIFVENEIDGLPGWAGAISEVDYQSGAAHVTVLGGASLFDAIDTLLIEQSGGTTAMIASRLVAAANAKKGAHGDLTIGFVEDGTSPNYGLFEYEGDVLQGLLTAAERGLSEFHMTPTIAPGGATLAMDLHWNARFFQDFRGSADLMDGTDGNVVSGAHAIFSGLEVINHARLRGATTTLADYVDYSAVSSIIEEIAPEIEVTIDTPSNFRRREDLELSVSFGYSEDVQRALAQQLQQKYVDYYKTFLYAFHERNGMPFLPGYDWEGPGQRFPERKLTEADWRTINKLGLLGKGSIVTVDSARYDRLTATDEADITDWQWDETIDTIQAVAMAKSPLDPEWHVLGDAGGLYHLDEDNNLDFLFQVEQGGETLVGVASDGYVPETVWCLFQVGGNTRVRWYNIEDGTSMGTFDIAGVSGHDFHVDADNGQFYMVKDGSGLIERRDINSGTLLDSYASGFGDPAGLSGTEDFLYVINASGSIRILHRETGDLAGAHDTGDTASGLFIDPENRRGYVIRPGGNVKAYDATIALADVEDIEAETGAPGFDVVKKGRFCHIVMTDDLGYRPWKWAAVTSHPVAAGETLWQLSKQYYGVGTNWRTIYYKNRTTIRQAAVAHGLPADSHRIFAGTTLVIPGAGGLVSQDEAVSPKVRYLTVHSKGDWDTETVPGPIGEPDTLQKEWVVGRQKVGTAKAKRCHIHDPKVVIYGEEGRVNDWFPKRDGYGVFRSRRIYRSRSGYSRNKGPGWYPQDWDIPDAEWLIDQQPWPEGEAYLAAYLARRNSEVTVQSFAVINRDNLWASLRLGGVYTLTLNHQGPVPAGITLDVRILGFAPNEMTGTCELFAEAYIP